MFTGVNSHYLVVVLGPSDFSGGAGLHLTDEGGIVIQQYIHSL